ncbi:MAG: efflux RND transporter periplasmic adaptor subunit [Planctomycetota bacterium]|jgi:HlyD family secretion protein
MAEFLKKLIWPAVIVLFVVGVYVVAGSKAIPVETAEVRRGPIEEYVTEEARTQLHVERIVTADIAGTLRRVKLEEGDDVAAGQVITTLEDTELRLSLELMRDTMAEVEARLSGVDVPLPKESEIQAAEEEHQRAVEEVHVHAGQLKAAEADLEFAKSEFRRIKGLFDSGSTTDRQFEQARRDLAVAQAALDAQKQRLSAAETAVTIALLRKQVLLDSMKDTEHLRKVYGAQIEQTRKRMDLIAHDISKATIQSPIGGVVLEKYLDSEQYVQPGTPIVKVGDMESIEIRADILSDEIGRIRPGQKVVLVGRAIRNPNATGRVKKVYPSGFTKISSLGVRQQRVAVLVDFDNSELGLAPGYELDVKIVVDSKDDAVLVPSGAVFATADGAAVFAVRKGKAKHQPIRTGLKGGDMYEAVEGLQPGDVVILRPPTDLEDGRRVTAE